MHGQSADLVDEAKILNATGTGYIKRMQTNNSAVFVAKIDDAVIGVVSCIIRPLPVYYTPKLEAYIDDVCVSPDFQRQGIATQLIESAKSMPKAKA